MIVLILHATTQQILAFCVKYRQLAIRYSAKERGLPYTWDTDNQQVQCLPADLPYICQDTTSGIHLKKDNLKKLCQYYLLSAFLLCEFTITRQSNRRLVFQ